MGVSREAMDKQYNKKVTANSYKTGDRVWVTKKFYKTGENGKLAPRRDGPFVVVECLPNGRNFTVKNIQTGKTSNIHHDRMRPVSERDEFEGANMENDSRGAFGVVEPRASADLSPTRLFADFSGEDSDDEQPPAVEQLRARNVNEQPAVAQSQARNDNEQPAVAIPRARNVNEQPTVAQSQARNDNKQPAVAIPRAHNVIAQPAGAHYRPGRGDNEEHAGVEQRAGNADAERPVQARPRRTMRQPVRFGDYDMERS